jgi:hypothetical protein
MHPRWGLFIFGPSRAAICRFVPVATLLVLIAAVLPSPDHSRTVRALGGQRIQRLVVIESHTLAPSRPSDGYTVEFPSTMDGGSRQARELQCSSLTAVPLPGLGCKRRSVASRKCGARAARIHPIALSAAHYAIPTFGYPLIVEAARRIRTKHFVLDGEAVLLGVDGISDFDGLYSGQHNDEIQLYAFDILALDGDDLRKLPLHLRKTNLARLLARRADGIHLAPFEQGEIGPDLFRAACDMMLEGLVSNAGIVAIDLALPANGSRSKTQSRRQ